MTNNDPELVTSGTEDAMNDTARKANNPEPQNAEHLAGIHLAQLVDADPADPLTAVVGDDRARIIVDWQRDTLDHGRYFIDPHTGKPDLDPLVEDVPVIPVEVIAEVLEDHGVAVPTRQDVRDFAERDGSTDPEIELIRARLVADPDLNAAASSDTERSICGVPESIFYSLSPADQERIMGGRVIAPPQAPTHVARWLARHLFSSRLPLPATDGGRRRRKVWMRTLVRVDNTWYSYERSAAADPPRWIAHADPEWMRARLRAVLGDLWYLKARTIRGATIYDTLKAWNPDSRTLAMVEDALADTLNVGTGTAPRELPDIYGHVHGVYSGGTRVLVRNGVLDVETGRLSVNTPVWFSLTRVEADYDQAADPYAATDWLRVLDAQWHDDPGAVACLQQWFGYLLSGRTDLHKLMWLFGPPGSAKSLIAAVLEALVGDVTELGLDALNTSFGLQQPYEAGATLAVMSDMRFGSRDSSLALSRLLAITGGDRVDIPRKYKPAVKERLPLRFHGTANEMPKLSDHAGALVDRLLLLETSRAFKRGAEGTDARLKDRIIANELGLLLRWAVEGLAQLDAAGGRFTLSKDADELASDAASATSNVRQFVEECCEIGAAADHLHRNCGCDYVDQNALFRVWGRWAAENKTGERMSKAAFRRALKSLGEGPVKPGQRAAQRSGENAPRVVWGIKRATTNYRDRDRFGQQTVTRTDSTDTPDERGYRDGVA